jgi:hypothetical protein
LVSGIDGNAAMFVESLNVEAYPSFILLDPSGKIVEPDIWPSSSEQVSEVLARYGIQKNACKTQRHSTFELQKDKLTLLPNPVQEKAIIQL